MNQLVLPEYGIHSFVFFFFVLSMQLFAIAWNLPLFAYHIHRYIKRPIMRGPGIYDPTTIMNHDQLSKINREGWVKMGFYLLSIAIIMLGLSFAFIPFFRILCETTSFNGVAQIARNLNKIATMEKVDDCLIRVQFNADVPSSMQWKFKPLQDEIYVSPGETALAFFTAYNPTNKPIVGISTYNLSPFQAAYYFNKIQCFCFDEQILNPGEEVDLPVFFYIDPDFVNDPLLEDVTNLLLSYTFFESGANLKLPSPFDPDNRPLNKSLQRFEEKEKKTGSLLESVNAIA
uniref:Cytochrome c oxidase assembly protein COX11, mitochondrial n=1 Tax=Meloidogyne javanica TaxID=6303 RepID=A0A915N7Q3_MELJA